MYTDFELLYDADMKQMGNLFEYVGSIGISMYDFVPKFMNSWVREMMDDWHPWFSNDPSPVLYKRLFVNDYEPGEFKQATQDDCYYENQLRWIGEMYGYLHYFTGKSSKWLIEHISFEKMIEYYVLGHEMTFSKVARRLEEAGLCEEYKGQ